MGAPDVGRSPGVRAALARMEEAEVRLDQAVLAAKQVEQRIGRTSLSDEDIRLVEAHARSGKAPPELRELQERIDRGELSWQDIAGGRHLDDPRVRAALTPGVTGMHQAYAAIEEGQDVNEIIDAGPPTTPPPPRADDARAGGYTFVSFDPDAE